MKVFALLGPLLHHSLSKSSTREISLLGSLDLWTFMITWYKQLKALANFPFETAVNAWARSFAALGIKYEGATMQLDLCDRTPTDSATGHNPLGLRLSADGFPRKPVSLLSPLLDKSEVVSML
ncbi:hypothetical protein BDR26DRAFT_879000 [Obelidium mucronatum]|nr:hypothetical protein BDR26DRAFT_879000 [Obelidium mucronatum]